MQKFLLQMTHAGGTPQRAGAGVNRAPYRTAVSAGGGGGAVLAEPAQRRHA
jgi:hypothetical protein